MLNRDRALSILSVDPSKEVAIELNSLSKSFNMAGWRVGMCLGPREAVRRRDAGQKQRRFGHVLAVQAGATEALSNPEAWHSERNDIYRERRQIVWQLFERLGFSCDRNQVGLNKA